MIKRMFIIITIFSGITLVAGPNAPLPKAEVLKLTGSFEGAKLSRDINILWLYGPEDHGGGEHDYIRIKDLFVPLLKKIPRVSVDEAFNFPSKAQFDKADLLIQFLHMPALSDEQFKTYQAFVDGGGGKLGIKQGQHLVYEKDTTPLCNLHVTLMQGMGLEREHFVDGTGRLTGLS